MSESTAKICALCKKDLSASKQIKDSRGRCYCAACYEAALQRQRAAAPAAPVKPVPAPAEDEYDLAPAAPSSPKPVTRAPGIATPAAPAPSTTATVAASSAPKPLPEFCPNCGAKIVGNRKICFKCNRDVTQMDKLLARRAAAAEEEAKGPDKKEVFATWFGRVSGVVATIVVLIILAFILWGIKVMFLPGGLWDHYPTTREAAVREFLQGIETGTDKSYDRSFKLISWRESTTGDAGQDARYKRVFIGMHDDFEKKYGKNWYSKAKLENVGDNEKYMDDEIDFRLTLGKDTYTIATQVQIDKTLAAANMTMRAKKPVYLEDGQNHFGVIDVSDYLVNDTRRMLDLVGPGKPEKFDLPIQPQN